MLLSIKLWLVVILNITLCNSNKPNDKEGLMHYEEILPTADHTGTVFFLHRAGTNGTLMKQWLQLMIGAFRFPHIKIIFPTAPYLPYGVLENRSSNIWYDQNHYAFEAEELLGSFNKSKEQLEKLIEHETSKGIKRQRMIFGGFSMGGVMAMHIGYRFIDPLAGVFALSAFLPRTSVVFKNLNNTLILFDLPPLFLATGASDEFILERWCRYNVEQFRWQGVEVTYHVIPETLHSLHIDELTLLFKWIQERIPIVDLEEIPSSSSEDPEYRDNYNKSSTVAQ